MHGGGHVLAIQVDITLTDVATWLAIVATILGGIRVVLRFALRPLGEHLAQQDEETAALKIEVNDKLDTLQEDLSETKEVALDAKHESSRARAELKGHMHWEERPWWQRLGRQPTETEERQ